MALCSRSVRSLLPRAIGATGLGKTSMHLPLAAALSQRGMATKGEQKPRFGWKKKAWIQSEFEKLMAENELVIALQNSGLDTMAWEAVREQLKEHGVGVRWVRGSLAKRAVRDTPIEQFSRLCVGASVYAYAETASPKVMNALFDVCKHEKGLVPLGGKLSNLVLTPNDLHKVAELAPKEQLYAELISSLSSLSGYGLVQMLEGVKAAPIRTLSAAQQNVIRVLDAASKEEQTRS